MSGEQLHFVTSHGIGKTGNLDVHFSTQGKHVEFTPNTAKILKS